MSKRSIIENYYCDINNLCDVLSKLVNSYRLLIGGANELNGTSFAKKKEVKDALDTANELGKIINDIIKILDQSNESYLNYCNLKCKVMKEELNSKYIRTEIDEELQLKE